MLGLENIMAGASDGPADALNANLDLQTQSEILESDALALAVIKELHLDKTKDFQPFWNPFSWLLNLISPSGPADAPGASLEDSPVRRTSVLKTFAWNLKIKPVAGTRLIDIRFKHSDPKIAAATVNALMAALKNYGFETRYTATSESSDWLGGQLSDLKTQSENLQAKVVGLRKDSGIYSLGTDSQGHDQVYSETLDRLQQVTTALSGATSNRIMKGAVYQAVKGGDPELISQLAGSSLAVASPAVQNSFTLLQSLRSQQSTLQSQIAQDSAKFGPSYPRLAEERSSLQSVNNAISEEVRRIGERAENDYSAAQTAEQKLQAEYRERKADAEKLNDKTIEYGIAKQEADDSRGLYEDLFKRLKEAGVVEGLRSSNITVVEPGRPPAKPSVPYPPIWLPAALLLGLFFGACAALLMDVMDDKITSFEGVEQLLGASLLGVLAAVPRKPVGLPAQVRNRLGAGEPTDSGQTMLWVNEPATAFAESLQSLRTRLLLSRSTAPPKVILVTSSVPGEGKSTVSANLSSLLARSGKQVLLVQADMRNPSLIGRFDDLQIYPNGLSVLLTDSSTDLADSARETPYGMQVLLAGPPPPYPAELLGSERMHRLIESWKLQFDFIVLDSPPLLAVTDAEVLSRFADITLLLARPGVTTRTSLRRGYEMLTADKETKVGIVLNAVDMKSAGYDEYFGYSGSTYYANSGDKVSA